MKHEQIGSLAYKNWKAYIAGEHGQIIFEFPLFSDAAIVGEIRSELGPYQLINTLAMESWRPAIILRVQNRRYSQENEEFDYPKMDSTQDDYYHDGSESDEMTALLSLCLGIRVKAGGATRVFGVDADSIGHPIGYMGDEDPSPPPRKNIRIRPMLVRATGSHSLEDAKQLAFFPLLPPKDAIALARAARMYQEAIWIIDNTPELSWLMLTSAIETVAHQWRKSKASHVERMRSAKPKLEPILRKYARKKQADHLVQEIAQEIADSMGATKTFREFIIAFLPPPPSLRPPEWAQLSWEHSDMMKTLNKIYGYRSEALHGGKPFPPPMCEPPLPVGEKGEVAEIPVGLAASMKGGVWVAKDTPTLLHTYEYIVRNVILNWWDSLTSSDEA